MSSTGRSALVAASALLLLPAAKAGAPGAGLYGTVRKGPVTPVCHVGVPCDGPARVTLVFSPTLSSTGPSGSVRTGTDGRYRLALAPGYYSVTTKERIGIRRNIRPRRVHVRAGHRDRIDFFIDTGIR